MKIPKHLSYYLNYDHKYASRQKFTGISLIIAPNSFCKFWPLSPVVNVRKYLGTDPRSISNHVTNTPFKNFSPKKLLHFVTCSQHKCLLISPLNHSAKISTCMALISNITAISDNLPRKVAIPVDLFLGFESCDSPRSKLQKKKICCMSLVLLGCG